MTPERRRRWRSVRNLAWMLRVLDWEPTALGLSAAVLVWGLAVGTGWARPVYFDSNLQMYAAGAAILATAALFSLINGYDRVTRWALFPIAFFYLHQGVTVLVLARMPAPGGLVYLVLSVGMFWAWYRALFGPAHDG